MMGMQRTGVKKSLAQKARTNLTRCVLSVAMSVQMATRVRRGWPKVAKFAMDLPLLIHKHVLSAQQYRVVHARFVLVLPPVRRLRVTVAATKQKE